MFEISVNEWLQTMNVAWNNLLNDVDNIGNKKGFVWTHEEDIRSYLFCKIVEVLRTEEKWLLDLRTEVQYEEIRLDLALGNLSEDEDILGVQIKPSLVKSPVKCDINKLKVLMDRNHIKAGVFIGFDKHSPDIPEDSWRKMIENWFSEGDIDLSTEDLQIRRTKSFPIPDKGSEKEYCWDSVFIVIRGK